MSEVLSVDAHPLKRSSIPWSGLGDALWEHVFHYLSLKTRVQTEVVCRRWCKAIRSKRLWTSLDIRSDIYLSSEVDFCF